MLFLAVFVGILAVAVVVVAFLVDGYVRGLLHGITATTAWLLVWQLFLVHGGHMYRLSGVWGEDNTRDVLRSAKRRGLIYGWIDNLEIEGGDVDHLVVAPFGLVAIDSKCHTGAYDEISVERDCSRALAATRRASLILRSEGHRVDVATVVAIWGAQQQDIPETGEQRRGVTLLRGRRLKQWLRSRRADTSLFSPADADGLLAQLRAFRARIRPG